MIQPSAPCGVLPPLKYYGVENGRKPTDYSAMFTALDELLAANLPQMELYRGIGRIVSGRPEKGAAVAAAGYLQGACPDATGFSSRSLRRMRDFYRAYESAPEVMAEAMLIPEKMKE